MPEAKCLRCGGLAGHLVWSASLAPTRLCSDCLWTDPLSTAEATLIALGASILFLTVVHLVLA